jgi:hypothetical protein
MQDNPTARASAPQDKPEADLAEMISAVMRHPAIPADLHNHIGDWITSYGEPQAHEPERIRRALAEFDDGEEDEAGQGTAAGEGEKTADGIFDVERRGGYQILTDQSMRDELARMRAEKAERESEAGEAMPFESSAHQIADLLESEDTPEVLTTLLEQFCTELSNHQAQGYECVCSPATIRRNLPAILERAESAGFTVPPGGVMLERKGAA